jgi:hypothetical protein
MKWEIVNDRTDGGARRLEYIRVDYHRKTFWDSLWHEIEAGTIVHCNGKVLFADLSLYEGWWKSVSDHGELAKEYISGYFDPDLKRYRSDLCGRSNVQP